MVQGFHGNAARFEIIVEQADHFSVALARFIDTTT
jgi:hypothetical protein